MMSDAGLPKEGVEFLIFTSPVRLNRQNLPIEEFSHMILKLSKFLENLIFVFKQE
jgi:hypothetical protein